MDDPRTPREGTLGQPPRPEVLQFLTTEHFTLQSQRATASAETSSRLQLYIGALSSAIVALALVAQVSDVGSAFRGFAVILLPVVYMLGVSTLGRLGQLWVEWFRATQGMGRIRHYFLEYAPEMRPYLVMATTDEPWATLGGIGIGSGAGHRWWHGFVTAPAMVATVNSVVAGVLAGLLASMATDELLLVGLAGAGGFAVSLVITAGVSIRSFRRRMVQVEVAFPSPEVQPRQDG